MWFALHSSIRRLARRPAFEVANVLLLATGLGVGAAVWSIADAVLLRPLPYQNADRVVFIREYANNVKAAYVGPNEREALTEGHSVFSDLATIINVAANVGSNDGLSRLEGYSVTPNLFTLLGVRAAIGRTFTAADAEDQNAVIVLSDDVWRSRFGGDRSLVGRSILVNGSPHVVLGVMPPGVRFPDSPVFHRVARAEFWVPFPPESQQTGLAFGLLRPGIGPKQLKAFAATAGEHLQPDRRIFPTAHVTGPVGFSFTPLTAQVVSGVQQGLWLLCGAAGALCLVTLVNLRGLWLIRLAAHQRDVAVHLALGAHGNSILGTWLSDGIIVGLASGVGAVLIAGTALRSIVAIAPIDVPRLDEAVIRPATILAVFVVGVVGSCSLAIWPVARLVRRPVLPLLTARTPRFLSREDSVSLRFMAGAQVTLCTALAVSAGLVLHSLLTIEHRPLGFEPDMLLVADVSTNITPGLDAHELNQRYAALTADVARVPGVRSAAFAFPIPLSEIASLGAIGSLETADPTPQSAHPISSAAATLVSPGYFRAMRIPILQGRDFTDRDDLGRPGVAMIDERTAKALWPSGTALGMHVRTNYFEDTTAVTIVGVVGAVADADRMSQPTAQLYTPLRQQPTVLRTLVMRTTIPAATLVRSIRHAISAEQSPIALGTIEPMSAVVDRSLAKRRLAARLILLVAAAAVLLALAGVYVTVAKTVVMRAPEMGIRLALGARPASVLYLVAREGARMTAVGVLAGTVAAIGLSRLMMSQLPGIAAVDLLSFGIIPLAMFLSALAASVFPARRLSQLQPSRVLASE